MKPLEEFLGILVYTFICFGVGWLYRGKEIQTVEVPKIVTKVETQLVDHVIEKTITKTVKEPGNVETVYVTKEITKTETKDTKKDTSSPKIVGTGTSSGSEGKPQFMAGMDWITGSPYNYYPAKVEIGRRLIGPVWGQMGFDWYNHQASIGVRYEF